MKQYYYVDLRYNSGTLEADVQLPGADEMYNSIGDVLQDNPGEEVGMDLPVYDSLGHLRVLEGTYYDPGSKPFAVASVINSF